MQNEVTKVIHENTVIHPSQCGYYCEFAISNHTNSRVVYLDRWGNRVVLEPSVTYHNQETGIHIYRRNHTGERLGANNLPIPLDVEELVIHPTLYNVAGYYLTNEQILICLEEREHLAKHPCLVSSYDTVHLEAVRESAKSSPTITFAANDPNPNSLLETIYCAVFNDIVPIRCTHYPAANSRFEITISHGTTVRVIVSNSFDELQTLGHIKFDHEGTLIVLGVTEISARTHWNHLIKESVTYSRDMFQTILKREVAEVEAKAGRVSEDLKQTNKSLIIKIQELENNLREAVTARDTLMGGKKLEAELGRQNLSTETIEYRRDEQVHRSQRAAMASGDEILKTASTVAKVLIGVTLGAAVVKIMAGGATVAAAAVGVTIAPVVAIGAAVACVAAGIVAGFRRLFR